MVFDFTKDFVFFSDEAKFYVKSKVNWQNFRNLSQDNLHWINISKQKDNQKLMVCCGLWKTFEIYLKMLRDRLMPQNKHLGEGLSE